MKTVNRGWLKKQIEKGIVETVSCYSFDDMMGESRESKSMPVRMRNGEWKEGYYNVMDSDLRTKSGCAYWNENGTISLIIHSNCNVDLLIKAA